MLAACEPEPKGPVQVTQPEAFRHETERVRNAVDQFRSEPTKASKKQMEAEFKALDARMRSMEELAQTQSGDERALTDRQIVDLKHRRELHWSRAQTAIVETETVKRAEPVAERTARAERADKTQRPRRGERTRTPAPQQSRERTGNPLQFFQRLFR